MVCFPRLNCASCRKSLTKAAAAEAKAFLLEALGQQGITLAGLNCAQVLLHCLGGVATSEGLLSAGLSLLQTLLHAATLEVSLSWVSLASYLGIVLTK